MKHQLDRPVQDVSQRPPIRIQEAECDPVDDIIYIELPVVFNGGTLSLALPTRSGPTFRNYSIFLFGKSGIFFLFEAERIVFLTYAVLPQSSHVSEKPDKNDCQ